MLRFPVLAFVAACFLPLVAFAQPTITTQPIGGSVPSGFTFQFSVAATGTGTLTYQWKKGTTSLTDGGAISGATSSLLRITNAQVADSGSYSVVVTDGNALSTPSTAVTLTLVDVAPQIVSQSPGVMVASVGGAARLFANLNQASLPLTMQWRKRVGPTLTDLTGPFYGSAVATVDLTKVAATDFGTYTLEVSNSVGTVTSAPILLREENRGPDPLQFFSGRNPAPQPNALFSLAFSPSRYVAVGANGVILNSTDSGLTWQTQLSGFAPALNAVVYDTVQSQFLYGGGFTQLATSPNGTTWTPRAFPGTNGSFPGIASNGATGTSHRYVGVGGDFAQRPTGPLLRVSADAGATWTAATPTGATGFLNSVAFGHGRFVAVGGSGTIIVSSDHLGTTWSAATLTTSTAQTFNRVAFANGTFVAVGTSATSPNMGVIYTSSDGLTFTPRTSNATARNVLAVTHLSGSGTTAKWAAVTAATLATPTVAAAPALILISNDNGTTWTSSTAPTPAGVNLNEIAIAPGVTPRLFLLGGSGYIARTDDLAGFPGTGIVPVSFSAHANYADFLNDVVFDTPSNQFIAVGGSSHILTSPDGDAWTRRTHSVPLGFATGTTRMGANRLLVAGSRRIAYSDDNGATWSGNASDLVTGNDGLRGIAATPTLAVAVGTNGNIFTSTDGSTWNSQSSGTTSILQKVAHANGRWIAVGGNDPGGSSIVILTSDNGTTWTPRSASTQGQLWGVDFGGGVWLAAGAPGTNGGGGFVLRSLDNGVTWERRNVDGASFLYKVRYLHGVWYAVGANAVLAISRDGGESWTCLPLPARPSPQTFRGVAIGARSMIVVGNESVILRSSSEVNAPPVIHTAPASATFAEAGRPVALTVGANNALQAAYQWRKNGTPLTDGSNVTGATTPTLQLLAASASDAGTYDVVVTNSHTLSATSTAAAVFVSPAPADSFPHFAVRSPVPGTGTLYGIIHAQSRFVAVGNGGRVVTSANGQTWTPGAEMPFERARAIVFNGTDYFVAGSSGRIYVTASPENGPWTQRATSQPAPGWFSGLAYSGSNYVAVGDSGLIFSSTDGGATWAVRTSPVAGASYRAVAVKDGRFIAVGNAGVVVTSTDAITWTQVTGLPVTPANYTTQTFNAVVAANNKFVIAGSSGAILSSDTGLNWTAHANTGGGYFQAIVHDGTRYVFTTGHSLVVRSTDLATFTNHFLPTALGSLSLNALAVGGSPAQLVLVGHGGEIWRSSDGGDTWAPQGNQGGTYRFGTVRYYDDEFIAVGSGGNVLVSPDARTWHRVAVGTGHGLSGFAEGAGRFVLATEFGDLVSAADGIFTSHPVGDTVRNNGIVFAQGRFVVVADGGRVRTSSDGIAWTTHLSAATGISENLNSVTFFNNLFVAVGQGGRIATSPDGATWTLRTNPVTQNLNRVAVIDGAAFAIGDNRTILHSADGAAWNALPSPNDYNQFGFAFRDIAKLHDGYYIASSQGQFIKTRDFVGWTRVAQMPSKEDLASIAVGAGRVVITGSDGGAVLTAALPPVGSDTTIAVQPRPINTVNAGNNVVLTVVAHGPGPLSYQWRKNGTDIPGATAATILLTGTNAATAGSYTVVVAGTTGAPVTSAPAQVNIPATDGPAVIVDQPAPATVAIGGPVTFTVGVVTNPANSPVTYQWRRNGSDLTGATAAQLNLPRAAAADAGNYDVIVTRNSLPVTSAAAALTVVTPDHVLFQQFGAAATENSPARTVHDAAGRVYFPWSVQERMPNVVAGKLIGALARFDENTGALDATFRVDPRIRAVTHALVEPDGRLLVAARLGDSATVFRVSATGAIDSGFNAPLFARTLRFIARQSDGKVIVPVTESLSVNAPAAALGADQVRIYRLNTDGTRDTTFADTAIAGANGAVVNLFGPPVIAPDGKIYLVGAFATVGGTPRLNLARLNADGTLDSAFAGALPAGFASNQARAVALQSDGRPIIVGDFRFNARGTAGNPIMAVRFNLDGSLDPTFAMPLRSEVGINTAVGGRLRHLAILADDSFVAISDRLYRFFANGARDSTFVARSFGREAFWFSRDAAGRYLIPDVPTVQGNATTLPTGSGIARLHPDGNTAAPLPTGGWGRSAFAFSGAPLPDGRVWVAGNFNRFGPTFVPGLAQFNLNGTLSATQPASSLSMTTGEVAGTDNGKVFAWLETAGNTAETFSATLSRFNADGTVDSTFAPAAGSVGSLFAAPGGKLLLAQTVVTAAAALNGTGDSVLRRLDATGALDATYSTSLSSIAVVERNATTNAVTMIRTGGLNVTHVLPDSRALVVASAIDGNAKLQRLTATGAIDAAFNAPSFGTLTPSVGFTTETTDPVTSTTGQFPITTYGATDLVRAAVQLPSGKVYVGGRFALGGTAPLGLVRLNDDGSLDAAFTGAGIAYSVPDARPYVTALAHDDAGHLYVAGRFDSFNGTLVPGLFRLTPAGALDTAWSPGFGLRDVPVAAARLVVAHGKLFVFGTAGNVNESLPTPFRFVELAASATEPTIAGITPSSPAPGATITINGANLAAATEVRFTGHPGPVTATFSYDPANQVLTAVVPAGARTGSVQVVTPAGTSSGFSLTVPLVITGHSQHGAVTPGQSFALSIGAAGGAPAAYQFQWRRNGTAITGATSATYFIPTFGAAHAGDYDVTVSDGTTQLVGGPLAARVANPDRWVWRNRLPTGNDLRAVAYGAGRYVAVGLAGTIVTSTNGTDWVAQPSRPPLGFNDIFFNGSLFVAVGFQGNIVTSADGLEWTQRHIGAPTTLAGITFGHDKWIAVGAGGALYTAAAAAEIWTEQILPVTEPINDLAPTATGFVAVASNGYIHLGDSAATTWTTSRPALDGATSFSLFDVAVRGTTYVASGARRVYVSTDSGATWSNATLPSEVAAANLGIDWGGITADATDGFIVAGGSFPTTAGVTNPQSYVIRSSDATTWELSTANSPGLGAITRGPDGYVAVGVVGQISRTTTFGGAWTSLATGFVMPGDFFGAASGPAATILVGAGGNVLRSANHVDGWTVATTGTTLRLQSAVYADNKYVVVGGNNNAGAGVASILTSATAESNSWTKVDLTGPSLLNTVVHEGSRARFVTAGFGNQIYSATDPAGTWTPVAKPADQAINAGAAGAGIYILAGDNGTIFRSTNGTTWNAVVSGTTQQLLAAAFGAGRFVVAGFNNSNTQPRSVILTSTDGGQTWQVVDVPYTMSIRGLVFSDGRFRAFGGTASVLTSLDGVVWTADTSQFAGLFRAAARTPHGLVAGGTSGMIATLEAPTATVAVPALVAEVGAAVTPFTPLTAAGGYTPYNTFVTPALAAGLTINSATGQISGTPAPAAATPLFVGADDFAAAQPSKWFTYRFQGATQGDLSFTNSRLDFAKPAAGAGSQVREWDGDPSITGSRTSASFATDWVADIKVTNTTTPGTGEFVTVGLQAAVSGIDYVAIMLGSSNGTLFVKSESNTVETSNVAVAQNSDVRLRLAWNAATQVLATSFSTDGGTSYSAPVTHNLGTAVSFNVLRNGFFFGLFGNSNTGGPIPSGAVFLDDFSVQATSAATTLHTVIVTDASGLTARGDLRLTVTPATTGGTISSISPASAAPGAVVTITGTGLGNASAVSFNGVPAASFTVVSATEITAVIPVLATSGNLAVSLPSGPITSSGQLTVTTGARLRNLVDRASVGTGQNVLYANFTIEGSGNKSVLIRGVGPSLASVGVAGFLIDPRLVVYDRTGAAIAQNDNWGGGASLANAMTAAGAAPPLAGATSLDAALLLSLAPGTYTASLAGTGLTTGIGQLEVHETDSVGRLVHVSNRSRPLAGSPSVAGFTLDGTGSKTVLIRAMGTPLVPQLGASTNPTLSIFQGTSATALASNDDFIASSELANASAAAGALPLAPTDSALLLTLAPGSYTLQAGHAGGAAGFVLSEVFILDGYRPATFAPALIAPNLPRRVALGARVILNAAAIGKPTTVNYAWTRNGSPVTTAPGFGPSTFVIASAAATDAGAYAVTLTNSGGSTVSANVALQINAHAADGNGDGEIDLFELTRVIELFNTRNGTVRTGRYIVKVDTEDGFAPDPATADIATVSLARYHSADPNADGKIDLVELTRVIELYNYRVGTVRTGQYRAEQGTEDNFASGP